ncbi:MAG: sigma-70 family RNA polymerase sigma factor [Bacteroidales bacterium]|nr:sigma-70 family RNA polymerase sigma factor [Bacteroidales bacterium]
MNRIKELLVGEHSERAFRMIVNAYQEKVIRFISLFVSNRLECEELASDVFISLWGNKENLSDISDLENYIFIVAKNKALNHLRKGKTELINLDAFQVDAFYNTRTTPESIYISQEEVESLNAAINELPQKTKMAFLLVRENKMKYKDAAEVLGVSVKTIEKQVAAAVAKLKERLMK